MLEFHNDHHGGPDVALSLHEVDVPYGVVDGEGPAIRSLEEKPQLSLYVNAGIYLLEPTVDEYVPSGERFNMTDLIDACSPPGSVSSDSPSASTGSTSANTPTTSAGPGRRQQLERTE